MGNINLVTNPSFETNLTGWSFSNANGAQDVSPNVTMGAGLYSCKVTSTVAAAAAATYTVTGLTPGKNYTFSFYVKISSAVNDFSVVPSVDGAVTSVKALRSGDQFVRRFIGFQATTTSAVLRAQTETALTVGDLFWIDRVMVTEGGLLPYFDGSYPFSTWNGTANASTSTNSAFTTTLVGDNPTSDETVLVNGFCLNTLAWNISTQTGRFSVPSNRGDDLIIPGSTGRVFVANKPIDSGLFTLSMFVLGAYANGGVPSSAGSRALLQHNLEQILRQCYSLSAPVTIHVWQPNGSVRVAQATLTGSSAPDVTMFMGGRRAELSLAFEVLSAVWSDAQTTTVTGTPSAAWSNQTLTLTPLQHGTAPIDDSVVTVTGPITNPVVSNTATGTTVSYIGTVPSGQSWVIDSGQFTSKVNGVSVLSATTHTGHPRFVLIDPGTSFAPPNLTLSGTSTTSATNLSVTAVRKHLIS